MSKFDFTSIIDRRGKDALAIDAIGTQVGAYPDSPKAGYDVIPMWVADMNFAVPECITKAIMDRCSHPTFGYFSPRQEYFDSIIRWRQEHTGLTAEHIGYENGVLGGVTSALNVLCQKGDKVLLHAPTYCGFTQTLENNGYKIVLSQLVKDKDGIWRMDFSDMERIVTSENIHAMVFCSPHNPTGRVWEQEEIKEMMDLMRKHDVYVVSDEIWADLTLQGYHHTPTQKVSDDARMRTISLYAPSKTFNIAGLVGSYHIIYNKRLRDRLDKESSLSHYNDMNVLSMHALIGAYSPMGRDWLQELRGVLTENADYACSFINSRLDGITLSKPQGTYMIFPDCEQWCRSHGLDIQGLLKRCWDVGVAVQDGRMFHGDWNLRINLASPLSRIKEAMERMDTLVIHG